MTNKTEILITARDQFSAVFDKAERMAKGMDSAFGMLSRTVSVFGVGLSIGGFAALMKGTIDAEDHLNDLSKTTRIAIEDLAGLASAAKKSDSDLDSTASAINKLAKEIGKNAEKFALLGITAKDPLEAFGQLADVLNAIEDPNQRAAVAGAALGKAWEGSAPLLAEGSKRIRELIATGREHSRVTKESAERADAFNDKLQVVKDIAGGWTVDVADPIVRGLLAISEKFEKATGSGKEFWRTVAQVGIAAVGGIGRKVLPGPLGAALDMAAGEAFASLEPNAPGMDPNRMGGGSVAGFKGAKTPGKPSAEAIKGFIGGDGKSKKAKEEGLTPDSIKNVASRMNDFRILEESLNSFIEAFDEGADVIEKTRTPAERLGREYEKLNKLLERGAINQETYGRAVLQAQDDFEKAIDKSGKALDTFAENAAKGMQDAFADFFFDPFKDGLSGMVHGFEIAVRRMVAEAAAADLTKWLFGKAGGGQGGGVLGGLFETIIGSVFGGGTQAPPPLVDVAPRPLPSFAVGTDFVPRDMIALIHRGERITPASQNRGGGGGNVVMNFAITGPVDQRSQSQIAAAAYAGTVRAHRRNG